MVGALAAPRRWWHASLRLRLTTTGAVLAAATFAGGSLLVLTLYHGTLVADQERAARSTASTIATLAGRGTLPVPIPMPVGISVPRVQVLAADDAVLTGDPASVTNLAMLTLGPGRTPRARIVGHPSFLAAARRVYVVAIAVAGPRAASTVVAALSLDTADDKARQAGDLVGLTSAGALLVVMAVAWITAGRALRPVEVLRRDADDTPATAT